MGLLMVSLHKLALLGTLRLPSQTLHDAMWTKSLLYAILALSNLLACSAARHVALRRGKRGGAGTKFARSRWRRLYQRRGTIATSNLTLFAVADTSGQGEFYYTDITIGTPPQHFVFEIDTTSADISVQGTNCQPGLCPSSGLYNASASSTAINTSTVPFSSNPDDKAYFFTDTIDLGPFSVANTQFLVVISSDGSSSEPDDSDPASGFVGLGFPAAELGFNTRTAFWESIMETGQTEEPIFSLWLAPDDAVITTGELPGGSLTFGGVDQSLFSGDIEYHALSNGDTSIDGANQWNVDIQGESVIYGYVPGVTSSRNCDSRANFPVVIIRENQLGGPGSQITKIWDAIPGAKINETSGMFTFPCNSSLNMSISFGGRHWPINDANLNLGPTDIDATICLSNIFSGDGVGWTLGLPFLKNVYTVFRQNPLGVGFAELSTLAGGQGVPNSTSSTGPGTSSSKKPNARLIAGVVVGATAVMAVVVFAALRCRSRKKGAISQAGDTPLLPSTVEVASELVPVPFMLDQAGQQGEHRPGQKMQPAALELPSDSTPPAPVSVINEPVEEHAITPEREDIHPEPTTSPPSYVAEA
ncbi:aspartic peptidase domain-containing protein [Roridomyces roridus]|uniref:Aspartic peptidase domain-containing protein n=1 Tax=Roridomyces roridus TaxID=1738132 RepID=A0AAD7FDM1_9AGAR|nr:aspartic peptidase domain-containing protein [Roridomyces roridus]